MAVLMISELDVVWALGFSPTAGARDVQRLGARVYLGAKKYLISQIFLINQTRRVKAHGHSESVST